MMPGIDLSHTPGIHYALAYWLSCLIYIQVLPQRKLENWKKIVIKSAFLVCLLSFMAVTDGIDVTFFVPCMLLDVSMMFTFLFTICDIPWKKAAYFCTRAFMLGEFAAALEWQVYYFLSSQQMIPPFLTQTLLVLAVVYAVVFVAMYLIERQYTAGNALMHIGPRELLTSVLITISVYIISNLSFVTVNTPFSSSSTSEIFIIRSLVDIGGVGILLAMHLQQQSFSSQMEVAYLEKMLALQYDNYRISEESVKLVNQKYHDLKHQIAILRSNLTTEEKLESLDAVEKEIRTYEAQNKTGNSVLDIVLTAKSLQCQREGIQLTVTADGNALQFMQPMDLSILFGNMLDNAIEGVQQLDDPARRLIHLTVNQQKQFVRVHVENCCNDNIHFVNGMPETTKANKDFHGFGMKSIRNIAEKYGGSASFCAENGWFEVRLLFTRA